MDVQLVGFIIFVLIVSLFLWLRRKEIQLQKIAFPFLYILIFRTKLGINAMDAIAKRFGKAIRIIGLVGIFIGFIGMGLMAYMLIESIVKLLILPGAAPSVGLVLPFKAGKAVFYVPFFYWVISIFIIAVVHEFSHGVMARANGLKIQSSGFAFFGILLPILPAAFVEPDEKALATRPRKEQLSLFAAGPLSNIIMGIVIVLIFIFVMVPLVDSVYQEDGVVIGMVNSSSPAALAGISAGERITAIDGIPAPTYENLSMRFTGKKPGDVMGITTNVSNYTLTLAEYPSNKSAPYLGIGNLSQSIIVREEAYRRYTPWGPAIIRWMVGMLYWLYVLSIGIGLFNLAPLGPVDGGRMLQVALQRFFEKKKADMIWARVSIFFFALILMSIVAAFIR